VGSTRLSAAGWKPQPPSSFCELTRKGTQKSFTKEVSAAVASVKAFRTIVPLDPASFPGSHYRPERDIGLFGERLPLVFSNIELIDQTVKISSSHAESPGTLGFSPAALAQGAHNQIPFKPLDLLLVSRSLPYSETFRISYWLLCQGTKSRGEIRTFDSGSIGKNYGTLDDILQFPDVPRPAVLLQRA
jgi:hypothetical protein